VNPNINDLYIQPVGSDPEQEARIGFVRAAVDVLRFQMSTGQYSAESIPEVSDVIYLADYIERGVRSHWLKEADQ